MPSVTYDSRSFLLDGKRIWLVSGSVHYFRTPAPLWRDRLIKAKRGGLNCIETFVPWNIHEPAEGRWDFAGDRDVAAFIRLAGELGLYVILRPGPFIDTQWDFGGLPAWLTAKQGTAFRTSNASYTHFFDKFFRQLLPRLADLQITHSGSIILIQNEHEYVMTASPDRQQYLQFISQLIRRAGFDVPIITCNRLTDPPVADAIETAGLAEGDIAHLRALRARQPNAPLLVSDFATGQSDTWGTKAPPKSPQDVARQAMELLGCGAQFNYTMYHGGTNFAFFGGRSPAAPFAYQTTGFDCDAPIAEGGGLTPKYYLTRLVNLLAGNMGAHLATCTMDAGALARNGPVVLSLVGPRSRWTVVSNGGDPSIASASILLNDGRELAVPLGPLGAAAVAMNLRLTDRHLLDFANLTPVGFFGDKLLVLHGPDGAAASLSINGAPLAASVGVKDELRLIDHQGLTILLLSSDLAQRCWPMEQSLVIGPAFVGETPEQVVPMPGAKDYAVVNWQGQLTRKKESLAEAPHATPKLPAPKRISQAPEVLWPELDWRAIPKPQDVDRLGQHYGYVWYQAKWEQAKALKRELFLPQCADRALLYLNGKYLGTWGEGPDGFAAPLAAALPRGPNTLVAMVDNLGRFSGSSRLGELKGLFGGVYHAKPIKVAALKLRPVAATETRRLVPRALHHLAKQLEKLPLYEVRIDLPLPVPAPVHVAFSGVANHAALTCNDRVVGFFESGHSNFGSVTLTNELHRGKNQVRLLLWGEVTADLAKHVHLHLLEDNLTQSAQWSWRPWEPRPAGPAVKALLAKGARLAKAAKTAAPEGPLPSWYASSFAHARNSASLFLRLSAPSAPTKAPKGRTAKGRSAAKGGAAAMEHLADAKGQIYLNGRNIGRFWTRGPQELYYLPECWLAGQNELMLFVEDGNLPACRLELVPRYHPPIPARTRKS